MEESCWQRGDPAPEQKADEMKEAEKRLREYLDERMKKACDRAVEAGRDAEWKDIDYIQARVGPEIAYWVQLFQIGEIDREKLEEFLRAHTGRDDVTVEVNVDGTFVIRNIPIAAVRHGVLVSDPEE